MGKFARLMATSLAAGFMNLSLAQTELQNPDLPPTGRSRFDQLIGAAPVPYPFDRLLGKIEAQLEKEPGLPPLKITLIPLGRSLQRAAAAPDFFRFPRVVVAVDGASKPGFAPLQDRLFIGYQEKAAILEIISYNEVAGRFEFQVVRDYRRGGKPVLQYTSRALCLSCHQNAAPMFARPLWDETPANPVIAAALRATRRDFYGVSISGTDTAYFIDAATDRANLFPVWQRIWRDGCGNGTPGARCRRDWFDASVRYALSGALPHQEPRRYALSGALPDGEAPRYAHSGALPHSESAQPAALPPTAPDPFAYLQSRWSRVWPRGLPIPNPDLPNRDPLQAASPAVEPLNPRAPLETWTRADPPRLIAGLASLFNKADVAALDRALGKAPSRAERKITLPCRITATALRTRFVCGDAQQRFSGVWHGARGEVGALKLSGAASAADLRLQRIGAGPMQARFALKRGARHARLDDGRRIVSAQFKLAPAHHRVTLTVRDDFAALRKADLSALAATQSAFRPEAWFAALVQAADPGAPVLQRRDTALPRLVAALPAMKTHASPASASVRRFERHCAQCHRTPDAFPPNFLQGDRAAQDRRLTQCAERIYYRLSMWRTSAGRRAKTPMPPPFVFSARGRDAHAWVNSPELTALIADAGQRIRRANGQPEALLARPYETLRACLAF